MGDDDVLMDVSRRSRGNNNSEIGTTDSVYYASQDDLNKDEEEEQDDRESAENSSQADDLENGDGGDEDVDDGEPGDEEQGDEQEAEENGEIDDGQELQQDDEEQRDEEFEDEEGAGTSAQAEEIEGEKDDDQGEAPMGELAQPMAVERSANIPVVGDDHEFAQSITWNPGDPGVVLQDVLQNMMDEFAKDVIRINQRYNELRRFLIRFYGTDRDGRIVNTFDNHNMARIAEDLHPSYFRKRDDEEVRSVIDDMKRRPVTRSSSNEETNSGSSSPEPRENRASRREEQVVRRAKEPKTLSYPFILKEDEQRIFKGCGNIASTYAQRLAKILFAESLELYFKDQDPQKREWLHEAVDFRFPTPDKYNHAIKWKNCSNAINKNMREFNKDKKEKVVKEIRYVYVTKEQEQECFSRAAGDAIKYGEYLSLILFEGSWDKFFKEQDQKKKDWLRECIDKRYPINDREKSAHRWKVCAAACNRNRTKIVGADGKEDPFPYFPQEIEEKCFSESSGVPAVYAEMIAKHLFPDTLHLMFKDQELGRRHWLHHHVDQRFPTPGKLEQAAKWKSITQAINKNIKTEVPVSISAPVTPVAKSAAKAEVKKEVEKNKRRSEIPTRNSQEPSKDFKEEPEDDTGEPENKRPRRAIRESQKMQEAQADSPPTTKKVGKNGMKIIKTEPYSRYPYVTQAKEIEIYESCNSNPQTYAKRVGRLLFEDTLNYYYKDQDPERRQWMREIIDFRFPTPNAGDQKQKWKNVCAAINKNMILK